MTREDILAKLKTGEDSTVEFKIEDVHADSLASEIVAFANAYGGSILIGVDDGGQVIIEYLGEGILTMRREMRKHNGTEPHFEERGDEFVVTLWGTQPG